MGKIDHLSAGEGKMELWNTEGIVFASSDPKELAKAFKKYGYAESFSTSSSFEFGQESGFKTDDEPSNLLDKAFEIVIGKGE